MAPASNGKRSNSARSYQSVIRTRAASQTRATILATAMRLFLEHGYGKVTVSDIATQARLALPTVYASTGGKAAILGTLIEQAMQDPIVEETLSAVRKSKSGTEILGILARGVRLDNERHHDIIAVMKDAAAVDVKATTILRRSDEGYRQALGQVARRLHTLKALATGITEGRATDVLWFYFGHDAWHLLVADRGWPWDNAESWLRSQAAVGLLARP